MSQNEKVVAQDVSNVSASVTISLFNLTRTRLLLFIIVTPFSLVLSRPLSICLSVSFSDGGRRRVRSDKLAHYEPAQNGARRALLRPSGFAGGPSRSRAERGEFLRLRLLD